MRRAKRDRAAVWYLGAVCLPSLVFAVCGVLWLRAQAQREAADGEELRLRRVEALAGEFQDAVREASGVEARQKTFFESSLQGLSPARFVWSQPQGAVVASISLAPATQRELASKSRWNEWTGYGKKRAARGLMPLESGGYALWARVDDCVYGAVSAEWPVASIPSSHPWAFYLGLLLATVALPLAGGILLWRKNERERVDGLRKTAFVTNVSHELKTPLTAIGLWTDVLRQSVSPEERAEALETIESENARMLRMVDRLLDFTRLERGVHRFSFAPTKLRMLAEVSVGLMRGEFPKGISVQGEEVELVTDSDAVQGVIVNLLGNAVKYAAKDGPVEVRVERTERGARLSVADRGPGLTPQQCRRVFERFYRTDAATTSAVGGLGLGLTISKFVAEGLGGSLVASARAGGGCVFALDLPSVHAQK